jgi:uncharacterized protein YjbJ (UPF0337 family)
MANVTTATTVFLGAHIQTSARHRTYRWNAAADTARSASLHRSRADSADRSRLAGQALQPTIKETILAITPNKDQVKGELKDLGGKTQEEAGKLVGSEEQQRSGLKKQTEGKLQKAVGDVKEVVTDAVSKA